MPTSLESQHRGKTPPAPGRIDPDVVIPASVKAAAARADEIHKSVYPEKAPAETPPASSPPPLGDGGQGAPKAGAEPKSPTEASAPATLRQEGSQPASQAPYPTAAQPDPSDWEHKFKSMQGRYDRSQETIRQMGEQITNLQNVLATLSTQPVTEKTPHELRPESLLSPEEVNEYGSEFLDVVGKKAREAASPLVRELQAKIDKLEGQLGQVGTNIAQNDRNRMFAELDRVLPFWRQINTDPKFFSWLALPDPYSGGIRHRLLEAAWASNDTARSLAFFRGFLTDEAAVDPAYRELLGQLSPVPPNGSQPPQPPPGQQNGKIPLEQFAAPGRAKSAAELPAEKPVVTRAQITRFYADAAAGKYRGNEAEKARLEKIIFDAQADGRIIG